jgi:transcriptional regulator with XRE-family HTH domain
VSNRVRSIDQAAHHGRRLVHDLGEELREARLRAGLRQVDIARVLSTSQSRISAIEHGLVEQVAVRDLATHAGVVGLRLHARMYPAGPPLRDQAQLALLERLRRRLNAEVEVGLEIPIGADPRDARAWDMVIRLPGQPHRLTIGIEAISRIRDVQAQVRAAQLKRHDANVDRLILLAAATHANRRALTAAEPLLAAAFPVGSRSALAALAAGRDPGDDALILL